MNFAAADAVVNAVLYEGYVLYPYRASSIKNRQRWTFGGVYPPGFPSSGPSRLQTQALVCGTADTRVALRLRFLQPVARTVGAFSPHAQGNGDDGVASWHEAIEREVAPAAATLAEWSAAASPLDFSFGAGVAREAIPRPVGPLRSEVIRSHAAIRGAVSWHADELQPGAWRLTVQVDNATPGSADAGPNRGRPDAVAQRLAFMSTHLLLGVEGGGFVSLIDPPPALADAASRCQNQSAWPVLLGEEGATDTLLCSPIILYDHPRIAPESAGDLFDGTEIDEILTLRILTLTDAEKAEIADGDPRARALLRRTESLGADQLERLHGMMRDPHRAPPAAASPAHPAVVDRAGLPLRVGARVRLQPRRNADVIDLALAGLAATVDAIEVDFEQRVHVAVTVDMDPGRDLGAQRLPGHRFFFAPDEVQTMAEGGVAT